MATRKKKSGKTAEPRPPEPHKIGQGAIFRDIILGGQDGIVNVLGIMLGVATATGSSQIVLLSGFAAIFAESVSMAAVAYTSSRAEIEHYRAEVEREKAEMANLPDIERQEIRDIYRVKGFEGEFLEQIVDKICSNDRIWLDTMMKEELKLENPDDGMSPFKRGILVGASALVGSFIPIVPFMFMAPQPALPVALVVSLAILFTVGAIKSNMASGKWLRGGLELMLIGGAAALAGYLVGLFFQMKNL